MPSTVTRTGSVKSSAIDGERKSCEVCAEMLRHTVLFAGLSTEQLQLLVPPCRRVPVPEGSVLCARGDEARELYVVLSGEICLEEEVMVDERLPARTIVVERVGPNGAVGLCSLLRSNRSFFTARCSREAEVLVVRTGDLKALMKAQPALGLVVLENAFSISFERLMASHQRAYAELALASLYGGSRNY